MNVNNHVNKQHLKSLIENVIFQLITKEYYINNSQTEKWTVNTKATTLSEYIDSNCEYFMSKLEDTKYQEILLRYHELNEMNDDINEEELNSLESDISDPICVVFPNLNTLVHFDFACSLIEEIKNAFIDIVINSKS